MFLQVPPLQEAEAQMTQQLVVRAAEEPEKDGGGVKLASRGGELGRPDLCNCHRGVQAQDD